MSMDAEFLTIARKHFDPFHLTSGTELMSPLLYSLARLLRPRSVVEYGSGYSTLFILRALADNVADVEAEKNALRAKTRTTRLLERWGTDLQLQADKDAAAHDWLEAGGVACGMDPEFYCREYVPHLFSFDHLPTDHEYIEQMRGVVSAIGHTSLFTQFCGQGFATNRLPPEFLPLDWVWNDCHYDLEFLAESWDCLNPSGGILILHNAAGHPGYFRVLQSFVEQRAPHRDLEYLVLEEPHKFMQNGCAILRRITAYQPRFSITHTYKKEGPPVVLSRPEEVLRALSILLSE